MTLFPYFFILTLATTIHYNKSSFISSSVDGLISNKSMILHSNHQLNTQYLRRSAHRRIYGGYVVKDFKKYSFMAYLMRRSIVKTPKSKFKKSHRASCGCTLLSPTHALTAAHCLRNCSCKGFIDDSNCSECLFYGVEDFTLYAGSPVPKSHSAESKLKTYYIHPEHKFRDIKYKCVHRFDIAVLELATPLQFHNNISIVKLPEPVTSIQKSTTTSSFFNSKSNCLILGWGYTSEKDNTPFMQEKLKGALVPLIEFDKCKNEILIYKKENNHKNRTIRNVLCSDTDICSKAPHSINGICSGDSGGPIICGGVQVGVSSWSPRGCVGPHIPNMYTRVDINVQWIRDIMSGKNITGRYMKIK